MKVPFVDLKVQYQNIKGEIKTALDDILENTAFVHGPRNEKFENDFAKYLGVKHFACSDSGTGALILSLMALGIKAGDEVITVPNSFFASTEVISFLGATPVFVDVDSETYLMDVSKLEAAVTSKTKAILPVHLCGQCADMDEIMRIARKHNLYVIEDACQAHGAEYKSRKAGTLGDLAAFSFYPGKNLGTYGEGGGVAVNNNEWMEKIKAMRDHGMVKKYEHNYIGANFIMSGIEGAVLNVKLKYLDGWTAARRRVAEKYSELLAGLPIKLPKELLHNKHCYHLYVIETERRDELMEFLKANEIATGMHYPIPIHLQKAYAHMGWKEGDFPVTEKAAKRMLSLPIYPEITDEQIDFVTEKIKEFYK